jgi:UDP-glucose 4-epimerase
MATHKPRSKLHDVPTSGRTATPRGDAHIVAVTGAFGSMGRRLVRLLEQDQNVERIVALDVRNALDGAAADGEPTDAQSFLSTHDKMSAHCLDLTEAGADRELASILLSERAGSIIHLALLSTPMHALEMAHELETIGTLNVLRAAAEARVHAVLSLSSSMCYGARADNPAWITEEQPLRPPPSLSLRDKAAADAAVLRLGTERPDMAVATARLGAVIGTALDHFWTRTLSRPVVPAVLGYDPLVQLMLADDAAAALHALWTARARGPFNVVGRGVLPWSHVLTRLGKAALPLPAGLGQSIVGALWSAQLSHMPRHYLDFLRWPWVCDGEKIRAHTGFAARDLTTSLSMFQGGRRAPGGASPREGT